MYFKKLAETEWNTGALYSADGQPMKATLVQVSPYDELVLFQDPARTITGIIPVLSVRHFVLDERAGKYDTEAIKAYAMFMYLRNQYHSWDYYIRSEARSVTVSQLLCKLKEEGNG